MNYKIIKFRVWDKEKLKFDINDHTKNIEFNLWDWADSMSTCLIFPLDSYIFQEYTGLTDKNGNPICEGDIVEWGKLKYLVEWNHIAYKWQGRCPYYHSYHHPTTENFRDLMNGVIVGNYFENNDLLK